MNNTCDCLTNDKYCKFVDSFHKHVFTGDLNIIENIKLRNLMKKGTKFRESHSLNFQNVYKSLCESIDIFSVKWAGMEKKCIREGDIQKEIVRKGQSRFVLLQIGRVIKSG